MCRRVSRPASEVVFAGSGSRREPGRLVAVRPLDVAAYGRNLLPADRNAAENRVDIESFNGTMRDEFLNESFGVDHARSAIAAWIGRLQHREAAFLLGYQTPVAFAGILTASGAASLDGSASAGC